MRIVCGVDTETTGLDPKLNRVIEIGAALFDADDNWKPLEVYSQLVWEPEIVVTPEAFEVNGISQLELKEKGITPKAALIGLERFAHKAEWFVAHNAAFDKDMLAAELKRAELPPFPRDYLCSAMDLKSNKEFKSLRLAHLALDYGVAVDPKKLHRASDDVLLMGEMLAGAKANLDEMIEYHNIPMIIITIQTLHPRQDNGKSKDIAKSLGYGWENAKYTTERFPLQWVKVIKENELEKEQQLSPLPVKRIK